MRLQNKIYLDCQSTLPMNAQMLQAMTTFLGDSVGNPHSSDHFFGWEAKKHCEEAATSVANLIGADSNEIIFTSGATEANNLALLGLAERGKSTGRRKILVSAIEHKCVLETAYYLEKGMNFKVELIPVNKDGMINLEELRDKTSEEVLLVSIMAVNNEIGTIQNLHAISEIARDSGVIFHTDAAQAPITMDVTDFGSVADLVSLSSHKIGGPPGIGALYINRELTDRFQPIFHGGGQQGGIRSGTVPLPLCRGFGFAADQLSSPSTPSKRKKLQSMAHSLLRQLTGLSSSVILNGPDLADRHIANINVRFEGYKAPELILRWQPDLAASTGSACASGIEEESYVLRTIGLTKEQAQASVRFSLGFETKREDIDQAMEIVASSLLN